MEFDNGVKATLTVHGFASSEGGDGLELRGDQGGHFIWKVYRRESGNCSLRSSQRKKRVLDESGSISGGPSGWR